MEEETYTSCIKINGIPILPPMMTKEIREEMANYKEIAITIEKNLAALHIAKECNSINYINTLKNNLRDNYLEGEVYSSKESLFSPLDSNTDSNELNVNGVTKQLFDVSNENIREIVDSNTEDKSENAINLTSSIVTEPEVVLPNSGVNELFTDIRKPQVPKTLDIIPLMHSNSNKCNDIDQHTGNSLKNAEDTPKLVRQGSYVLETPSPILLAHMQMELAGSTHTPCMEYIPTASSNTIRRKEWNIAQAKIEWEHESQNKDFLPLETQKCLSAHERTSHSSNNHKMCKSRSLQMRPETLSVMCSSTKSVDCIQSMLTKERMNESNIEIKQNGKHNLTSNSERGERFSKSQNFDSLSPCNSTYKVGGSLENLLNTDILSPECVDRKHNISSSHDKIKDVSMSTEIRDPTTELKSSISSDKLLTIYKRVQEMHKKQMAELVSRQQKEQMLLQTEFEKQLLLLLNEIKKSFPEVSLSLLSENILSPTFNQITSKSEQNLENIDSNTRNVKNGRNNSGQEYPEDNNSKMILCPCDYMHSEVNCSNAEICSSKSSHSFHASGINTDDSVVIMEKNKSKIQADNTDKNEGKLVGENDDYIRPNVSRQLFPLDSKTIHVPILGRTMYEAKHIKAACIINAYARGYLVRRMMRTERVITLKKTYKEALQCMLKLHIDAPLDRSEFNFLHRLRLQCDAASMNIVELFGKSPKKRMQVIAQDREIKQFRIERPTSARSYSFATQRTLARKKLKEMEEYPSASFARSCLSRSRCQTWTSDVKEKLMPPNILYHSIKRSTSAGTVRKPWR